MKRDEAEKLLGGYATGTLTAEERRALAEAALGDQQLFEALADEDALRDLLAQPGARARLREAVAGRAGWWSRAAAWLMRPAPMGTLAGLAAAAIAVAVFLPRPDRPQPVEVAVAKPIAAPDAASAMQSEAAPAGPISSDRYRNVPTERRVAQSAPQAKVLLDRLEEREKSVAAVPQPAAAGGVIGGIIAPAPQSTPPPPPPARAEAPQAAPPRAALEGAADLGRARTASLSKADAPVQAKKEIAVPVRYRLERLAADGNYVAVTPASNFVEGESVRLIVEPLAEGWLLVQLREGTSTRSLLVTPATPGRTYIAPPSGALPSGAGDRSLLVMLMADAPGVGQTSSSFRAPASPGAAGVRQGAAAVRQNEADEMKAVRRDDRLPVTIEIPLSYK